MESPESASVLRKSAEASSDRQNRNLSQGSHSESLKGVDMYRTIVEKKQADECIQQLKNKLDNIRRKEDHSLRLLERAAQEQEQQRQAHARKIEEESAKQLQRTQQKLQQDQLKQKLREAREEAKRRRREQTLSVLKEKQDFAQTLKGEKVLLDKKIQQFSETQRLEKFRRKQEVRKFEESAQENRQGRKAEAVGRLQETYTELLDDHRSAHLSKLSEIRRLEELAAKAEAEFKAKEEQRKLNQHHK